MLTDNLNFNEALSSGKNLSFWTDRYPVLYSNPVTTSFYSDVLIIGAGIAGMSVGYELCKRGKQVTVIDDGNIGGGESGRSSAHLVTCLDDRYYKLKKIFGIKGSKLAAESHSMAIDRVESIVREERIECDFERVNGYLFSGENKILKKEMKASSMAGIHTEMVDHIPGMLTGSRKALKFTRQAEFNILKYLDGLRNAVLKNGGEIYTHSHVSKIERDFVILSKGYRIHFKDLVLCTNSPISNQILFPVKQYPFRSYVIAGLVKKGVVPHCLYWDTGNKHTNRYITPYHFVRLSEYSDEFDLLISGGEDHPTADTDYTGKEIQKYEAIEQWTRENFPLENILYRWSGQLMETMDCLGYIGKVYIPEVNNAYVVTGDTGNGITNAVIAGMIIPDLIEGIPNRFTKLYDPYRFSFFTSAWVLFKETTRNFLKNFRNKVTYHTPADIKRLPSGQGFIIETESGLFGVTRDESGKLHYVNGKCTFQDAVLVWNPDEKTWECPLHGCRYTYKGLVVNGPSTKHLQYSSIHL